jgi:hypothetical protein
VERFVALFDAHVGYERNASRHKVPLHDEKAISLAMQFIADFKPHHVVLGGDMLDCGGISHHKRGKVGQLEGLRLFADAKECHDTIIAPIEALNAKGRLIYHVGNHEDWLNDLVDEFPALEGVVAVREILKLSKRWDVIDQGEWSRLGKLTFIHGDQVKGGVNSAKWAVEAYERNVRFGHFHTFQVATKTTPVDANGHTGMAVPCLCRKGPRYGEGSPNKWVQGFLWGYVNGPDGMFSDSVAVIINGKAIVNGKVYRG